MISHEHGKNSGAGGGEFCSRVPQQKPAAYRWSDEKSRSLALLCEHARGRLYHFPHLVPALNAFSNIDIIFHATSPLYPAPDRPDNTAVKRLRIAIVYPTQKSSQPSSQRRSCAFRAEKSPPVRVGLSGARNPVPCRYAPGSSSQHSHISRRKYNCARCA